MSRVVTPPTQQPSTQTQTKIPHEQIAMRDYEKWVKRGKPFGSSQQQDWYEAEKELAGEFTRQQTVQNRR